MAESKSPKKSKAATPRSRSKAPPEPDGAGLGAAGDDADLQTRIARRAYEISQGEGAGDAAENWLRAEREVQGA
jgi:hypothetical protein